MTRETMIPRRSFLALAAAAVPLSAAALQRKSLPVGLELFSVRDELKKDLMGTLRAVAKMGYEGVEFFSPYYEWTPAYAKEVRTLLDELQMRCFSTHNSSTAFNPDRVDHAIELNQILGSKYIVMAGAGKVENMDGWKKVAENLNRGADKMKPAGIRAGFHNHQVEFTPIEGRRPIEVLAANTSKDIVLQLDVGTCLEAGSDPVQWINRNPGRIVSIHCKEWSPAKGYKVLFGEGVARWKDILDAAEKTGGLQYALIEQEGSEYSEFESAQRCLDAYRKLRSS